MSDYKDYLNKVVDRRVNWIIGHADKVKRNYINRLANGVHPEQADREWLEQHAKGNGLDIACGDFNIGDSAGVDGDIRKIGVDFHEEGDALAFQEPNRLDYVVTNYLEAFCTPLKVLNEWWRCIRTGGKLAIVCRNADKYDDPKGPLSNVHRQCIYTKTTLSMFLYRAGFSQVTVTTNDDNRTLRALAIK